MGDDAETAPRKRSSSKKRPSKSSSKSSSKSKSSSSSSSSSSSAKGNPFVLMEDALEKLKLLDYETEFCEKKNFPQFSRTYFALKSENTSTQFTCFLKLIAFLMKLCEQEFTIDKFDDPTTSVNKVMMDLKNMGFEMDFPAGKLKQAYGDAVCSVLNFMCDRALAQRNFKWSISSKPLYPEEDFAEEAEVDEEADVGAIIDDEVASDEEEKEVMYSDMVREKQTTEESVEMQGMLEADLDPLVWKEELERVRPLLKVRIVSHGKEWRAHLEQTRMHEKQIGKILPTCQQQLKAIEANIKQTLERVQSKEKYINSQFEKMSHQYREMQQNTTEIQERYKTSNESVIELANTLTIITERLDEVKFKQESRGNSMTDTKPLVRMKQALKKLKLEMKQMEIRIGVVGHTLMQAKMNNKNNEMEQDDARGDGDERGDGMERMEVDSNEF